MSNIHKQNQKAKSISAKEKIIQLTVNITQQYPDENDNNNIKVIAFAAQSVKEKDL